MIIDTKSFPSPLEAWGVSYRSQKYHLIITLNRFRSLSRYGRVPINGKRTYKSTHYHVSGPSRGMGGFLPNYEHRNTCRTINVSDPSRGLGGVLHNFEREFGWDDTVSDPSRGMSGFLH